MAQNGASWLYFPREFILNDQIIPHALLRISPAVFIFSLFPLRASLTAKTPFYILCQSSRRYRPDLWWTTTPRLSIVSVTGHLSIFRDSPAGTVHSAVSNLSRWLCSILHLPACSPLSTNVLSASSISKNNGEEEQAATVLEKGRKLVNFVSSRSWQLIEKKRLKASAAHSLFLLFFLFVCFFIPPLAGIVKTFYSNSFHYRTSWAANGNPNANRRLCVIMAFWGNSFQNLLFAQRPGWL